MLSLTLYFLLILFRFLSFGEGTREFSLSSSFFSFLEEERCGYKYAASDADLEIPIFGS